MRAQVDKTAAIAACPRPKKEKEVRQFLGLASYYRRLIPRFADLTSPMTDLTRRVPQIWSSGWSHASWHLKGSSKPLLHTLNFSLPLSVVHTSELMVAWKGLHFCTNLGTLNKLFTIIIVFRSITVLWLLWQINVPVCDKEILILILIHFNWNNLPADIRQSGSIEACKYKLKMYFVDLKFN